ncbi:hypothetical protein GG344DRAFT_58148 [Lentinula edodes]|nr:hypothetical protein GG344DRAFT_58148 [Lentinula edodes]
MGQWPKSNSAWYNADASANISRQACIQGTRVPLMEQIIKWAEDTSDTCPPIFWLCGMAGTGKSTIAYSICEYFDLENQHVCKH